MGQRFLVASAICLAALLSLGTELAVPRIVAAPLTDDQAQPTNRLAKESSPYLRQHAHNP